MSNHYTARVAIIIPANVKPDTDAIFSILDPDVGGADSFTVPLSSDGGKSITHWATYTRLIQESYTALTTFSNNAFKNYVDSVKPDNSVPLGRVQSFKQNVRIGAEGQDFWEFVAAQGLVPYEPEM